jgi:hypothetical protein
MAKQKGKVNKSQEIRQLLTANPKMPTKEVISTLGKKGIEVAPSLVYFTKGRMRRRKGRPRKAMETVANSTGNVDAVATILKLKEFADQVGGMKKLKALVDALTE